MLCELVGAIISVNAQMRGTVPKRKGRVASGEPISEDFTCSNCCHLTGSYTGVEEGAKSGFVINKEDQVV